MVESSREGFERMSYECRNSHFWHSDTVTACPECHSIMVFCTEDGMRLPAHHLIASEENIELLDEDLMYLYKTSKGDGSLDDTELTYWKERRLVVLGWKKNVYGSTFTDVGRQLVVGLHRMVENHYTHIFGEANVGVLCEQHGVATLRDMALDVGDEDVLVRDAADDSLVSRVWRRVRSWA